MKPNKQSIFILTKGSITTLNGWKYVKRLECQKSLAWLQWLVFQYPNLLLDKRIKYVIDTNWKPESHNFNLAFTLAYYNDILRGIPESKLTLGVKLPKNPPNGWEQLNFQDVRVRYEYNTDTRYIKLITDGLNILKLLKIELAMKGALTP